MPASVNILFEPPIPFILRQAGAFRRYLTNLRPLWERMKPPLSEMEEEQWATHGHGFWPGLAPSTLARKKGGEMMVETDTLRGSLVDPNRAMDADAMSMSYGTDVGYAHWHQTGGSIPGRPPVRQVIPDPIPIGIRRGLETEMVRWIDEGAAVTWGRI